MTEAPPPKFNTILDDIQSELKEIRDEIFWIGLELECVLDKLQEKKED